MYIVIYIYTICICNTFCSQQKRVDDKYGVGIDHAQQRPSEASPTAKVKMTSTVRDSRDGRVGPSRGTWASLPSLCTTT